MEPGADLEHSSTAVITHRVQAAHRADYERWLQKIVPLCKTYPGHWGVQVIRPHASAGTTYTVVIHFDTEAHLLNWLESDTRKLLLQEVRDWLDADDSFTVHSGLDFWFTPEEVNAKVPVRWKQFLLTWSAIFPLVSLVSWALMPALDAIGVPPNRYLRILLMTGCVVLLMVYVVMPRYTKLVHRWLFR